MQYAVPCKSNSYYQVPYSKLSLHLDQISVGIQPPNQGREIQRGRVLSEAEGPNIVGQVVATPDSGKETRLE